MKADHHRRKMAYKPVRKETFFIATKVGNKPTSVNFYNSRTGEEINRNNIKREETSEGVHYVAQK